MPGETIILGNWNDTTPAAPAGSDNVKFQKDASSPMNVSANIPRADVAGTKYGTIIYDGSDNPERYLGADGEWHDIPSGLLPEGGTPGQILSISDASPSAPEWIDMPAGSLPNGGTTGQVLAKASDDDGDAEWADASGGKEIIGYNFTVPILSEFSWINQQSVVANQNANSVTLLSSSETGANYNVLHKAISLPITVTLWFTPNLLNTNYNSVGMCVMNASSGKLLFFGYVHSGGMKFLVSRFNNYTSWVNDPKGQTDFYRTIGLRVSITNNSPAVMTFYYSMDGHCWMKFWSTDSNADFVPDRAGVVIRRYHNDSDIGMTMLSWDEA